uniref:Uncharacterized protein n=1 Tax=Cacopsylla melanoneura TaxID=428564 RepID=A0A8D8TUB7_9HEMI
MFMNIKHFRERKERFKRIYRRHRRDRTKECYAIGVLEQRNVTLSTPNKAVPNRIQAPIKNVSNQIQVKLYQTNPNKQTEPNRLQVKLYQTESKPQLKLYPTKSM